VPFVVIDGEVGHRSDRVLHCSPSIHSQLKYVSVSVCAVESTALLACRERSTSVSAEIPYFEGRLQGRSWKLSVKITFP